MCLLLIEAVRFGRFDQRCSAQTFLVSACPIADSLTLEAGDRLQLRDRASH